MRIKLVVFDIAGTTVRDENKVAAAFQSALEEQGFQVPLEVANRFMGYEKKHAIRDIINEVQPGTDITETLVDTIHQAFLRRMIAYYRTSSEIEPLPHVEETLQALHQAGKQVAINTGFSRDIAEAIVERLQWREKGLIDFLIASDEVPNGRPHPDMIRQLMAAAGIDDPLLVAKVGDTEVDINEGRNAGCRYAIGITTGAYTREALQEHAPTHIIDDIREVLDIVKD
ncbi:MAG: HAD hydrolase-like protein [Candidatus Pseudobacter hemicellulosilyticus]|uniref:HAD hydrolase-like protein n=1 Tax=Candidatus Pseudobacter hemicellulosilyticus TaxID=3121375 RepID=A0AAJ6BGM4_9BACT|nr:MAG: HAD hydrolase-like protein [Pseudobacter sp.]